MTHALPVDKLVEKQSRQLLQGYISKHWKSRQSDHNMFLFFYSNQFVIIDLRGFTEAVPRIEPRACPGFLRPVHISPMTTTA